MSIYRRAAKVDANQRAVIAALEAAGCVVYVIRQPVDLLVGIRGQWIPCEVKDGRKPASGRKLKPSQEAFMDACCRAGLPVLVLTGPEQAVEALEAMT